jgi:hypothetical protein
MWPMVSNEVGTSTSVGSSFYKQAGGGGGGDSAREERGVVELDGGSGGESW